MTVNYKKGIIRSYFTDIAPKYELIYVEEDKPLGTGGSIMKDGGKVGTYPISEDSFLDMGEFDEMRRMEEKLHIVAE